MTRVHSGAEPTPVEARDTKCGHDALRDFAEIRPQYCIMKTVIQEYAIDNSGNQRQKQCPENRTENAPAEITRKLIGPPQKVVPPIPLPFLPKGKTP